jgi:hypothetical protein
VVQVAAGAVRERRRCRKRARDEREEGSHDCEAAMAHGRRLAVQLVTGEEHSSGAVVVELAGYEHSSRGRRPVDETCDLGVELCFSALVPFESYPIKKRPSPLIGCGHSPTSKPP